MTMYSLRPVPPGFDRSISHMTTYSFRPIRAAKISRILVWWVLISGGGYDVVAGEWRG